MRLRVVSNLPEKKRKVPKRSKSATLLAVLAEADRIAGTPEYVRLPQTYKSDRVAQTAAYQFARRNPGYEFEARKVRVYCRKKGGV